MIHLDTIIIRGPEDKRIELYQGDLTSLSPEEAVDLLVVSAFPGDYIPTSSSLIGALHRKGVSVAELSKSKAVDLRQHFSCWLSQEFAAADPGIQFKRILCFEPLVRGEPPELVGDIFRSLAPLLGDLEDVSSVAMPLVAAGDEGYAASEMLFPLLDAAIHWLELGLPLRRLKIVTYSEEQASEAQTVFSQKKASYEGASPPTRVTLEYDIFISYAHKNSTEMSLILTELEHRRPTLRIFLDREDINIGAAWQDRIWKSLAKCKTVLVLLSPQYLDSKVCKEEFGLAWLRSRKSGEDVIFPIYLYSAKLELQHEYLNYIDCREGDKGKLREACGTLISALDA